MSTNPTTPPYDTNFLSKDLFSKVPLDEAQGRLYGQNPRSYTWIRNNEGASLIPTGIGLRENLANFDKTLDPQWGKRIQAINSFFVRCHRDIQEDLRKKSQKEKNCLIGNMIQLNRKSAEHLSHGLLSPKNLKTTDTALFRQLKELYHLPSATEEEISKLTVRLLNFLENPEKLDIRLKGVSASLILDTINAYLGLHRVNKTAGIDLVDIKRINAVLNPKKENTRSCLTVISSHLLTRPLDLTKKRAVYDPFYDEISVIPTHQEQEFAKETQQSIEQVQQKVIEKGFHVLKDPLALEEELASEDPVSFEKIADRYTTLLRNLFICLETQESPLSLSKKDIESTLESSLSSIKAILSKKASDKDSIKESKLLKWEEREVKPLFEEILETCLKRNLLSTRG